MEREVSGRGKGSGRAALGHGGRKRREVEGGADGGARLSARHREGWRGEVGMGRQGDGPSGLSRRERKGEGKEAGPVGEERKFFFQTQLHLNDLF